MREFISLNTNISLTKTDDGWQSQAEIIVITSEVQYHLDEDCELKRRRRDCEQFRFLANEKVIAGMIEGLEKIRFEMQTTETAVNLANQERGAEQTAEKLK